MHINDTAAVCNAFLLSSNYVLKTASCINYLLFNYFIYYTYE